MQTVGLLEFPRFSTYHAKEKTISFILKFLVAIFLLVKNAKSKEGREKKS